jgi:hypothetical protein
MLFEKVTIKQVPDDFAVMFGLDKYNRSKMPQTFEFLQPARGADQRYITGIDEESIAIRQIQDSVRREQVATEIKALRESLEKLSGIADLSGTSTYWKTFGVKISADSDLVLVGTNPLDVIKYHVLVSNLYAAPNRIKASEPQYRHTKYYCLVSEVQDKEEVSTRKLRDRAKGQLIKISDDKDMMVMIGQFLEGDKYKAKMSEDTLYKMLSQYIEDPNEPDNVKRFTRATEADPEELQFKIAVDRAIKKRIIRFKDGYYQRGQVTLGRTPSDVLINLKKPDFATEFLSIRDELEA